MTATNQGLTTEGGRVKKRLINLLSAGMATAGHVVLSVAGFDQMPRYFEIIILLSVFYLVFNAMDKEKD